MANNVVIEVVIDDKKARQTLDSFGKKVAQTVNSSSKQIEKNVTDSSKQIEKNVTDSSKQVEKSVTDSSKRVEKNVTDSSKKVEKSLDSLDKRVKKLNASFKSVRDTGSKAFVTLGGAVLAVSASFFKLESGLANVNTLLSPEQYKQFGDVIQTSVVKSISDFGFTIEDSTKAMFDNVSALGINESSLKAFEEAQRLSVGGVTSLSVAVNGMTSIMNAFGDEVGDASDVSRAFFTAQRFGKTTVEELSLSIGRVAPTAKLAGIGFEELLATVAQLTTGGLSTFQSVTSLNQAIVGLLKPTDSAREVLEEFGVPLGATELRTKGFRFALERLSVAARENPDAIAEMITSNEALRAIGGLTEEALNNLDSIINEIGLDAIKSAEGTDSLSLALKTQQETGAFAFKQLTGQSKALFITLGQELAPTVLKVVKGISALVSGFQNLSPETRRTISNFLLFGTAIAGITAAVGVLGTAITTGLLVVLSPVGLTIAGIGAALTGLFVLWQKNFNGMQQTAKKFVALFKADVDRVINLFTLVKNVLERGIKLDFSEISNDFEAFKNRSTQITKELSDDLVDINEEFIDTVKNQRLEIEAPQMAMGERAAIPTLPTIPLESPIEQQLPDTSEILSSRELLNENLIALNQERTVEELELLKEKLEKEKQLELENLEIRRQLLMEQGELDNQALEQIKLKEAEINENFRVQEAAREKKKFRLDDLGSLKGFLSEASSVSKEAGVALKAVRIGEAIINTASGVANALATAPFPLNIANAAVVGASGVIQISKIAGQKFQEGAVDIPSELQATLHPGEMVLTKSIAEGLRGGDLTVSGPGQASGATNSGISNMFNFNFDGAQFVGVTDEIVEEIEVKLVEKLNVVGGGLQLVRT
jgi:TP901 family phage tail tape measure protein